MEIHITDQRKSFHRYLLRMKEKPVTPYDPAKLREKINIISIHPHKKWQDIPLDFFFQYHIFPPAIITGLAEWETEKREMQPGDTVVQQAYLPPSLLGLKLITGVRIKDIIRSENVTGYSYETLEGHPEKGISTFTFENTGDGVIFKIHTFSTPGNILTQLAAPFFTIPYQAYCTRKAMENVKRQSLAFL